MSDLISEGKHRAQCRSIKFSTTSTGKDQAAVLLVMTDENDPDYRRTATRFLYFSEKALPFAIKELRALGWTGDDIAELEILAANGELANEVEIVVEHEEYKGKVRDKVKWINSPGEGSGGVEKPLSDDRRKSLSDRVRAHLGVASPASTEKFGFNPEDDIPF